MILPDGHVDWEHVADLSDWSSAVCDKPETRRIFINALNTDVYNKKYIYTYSNKHTHNIAQSIAINMSGLLPGKSHLKLRWIRYRELTEQSENCVHHLNMAQKWLFVAISILFTAARATGKLYVTEMCDDGNICQNFITYFIFKLVTIWIASVVSWELCDKT